MDLLIDTYGTFIGSTGERLVLRLPSKGKDKKKRIEKEYPIRRINKIVILRPSSISTHAVRLALEHEVDIVYLGSFGKPVGRIFSSDSKGLATTRRAQLEVSNDPAKALALAKSFVSGKCRNQITYMRYLMAKYGADFEKSITQAETLLKTIEAIRPGAGAREQLLGIEGFIAEKYWTSLKQLHKFPAAFRRAATNSTAPSITATAFCITKSNEPASTSGSTRISAYITANATASPRSFSTSSKSSASPSLTPRSFRFSWKRSSASAAISSRSARRSTGSRPKGRRKSSKRSSAGSTGK